MKKSFLKAPHANPEISGELWIRICKVAKYMGITPESWIEKRLWGQLSRFNHKA